MCGARTAAPNWATYCGWSSLGPAARCCGWSRLGPAALWARRPGSSWGACLSIRLFSCPVALLWVQAAGISLGSMLEGMDTFDFLAALVSTDTMLLTEDSAYAALPGGWVAGERGT